MLLLFFIFGSTHLWCICIEQKEATGSCLGKSYWCLYIRVWKVHQIYGVFASCTHVWYVSKFTSVSY